MTDFLQWLSLKSGMFKPALPLLNKVLKKCHAQRIIDLGSGAGGALPGLYRQLKKQRPNLEVVLTDYYPNKRAARLYNSSGHGILYHLHSVDARQVPESLSGLRTMFLSLHHFRPKEARAILQNAVYARAGIASFEGQERSFTSLLAMFFSPITVLLATAFIRPFSWGRLVFTYLVPLVPLLVWWDGIISSLRTYSIREMRELIDGLEGKELYQWEVGRKKSGPATILYLTGYPR